MKHFLKCPDFSYNEVQEIFALTQQLKNNRGKEDRDDLKRQSWGMLFFKSSTRTRVSFEVGIQELGANALYLNKNDVQISRGETINDTAKVLSRYLHGLVIRCYEHSVLEEFATEGSIPVINALSDFLHPCQIMTDAFTLAERWAKDENDLLSCLKGKRLTFYGDCSSNMANSWILGGALFGMEITLAGPEGFGPGEEIDAELEKAGLPKNYTFTSDAEAAAEGADCIYTDVWVSMGKEFEQSGRIQAMQPFQVTNDLMARAKPGAFFMHCLPAHAGEEVSLDVLESPASIIFDEAENRLHTQKAIMCKLAEANR